ncbi:Crp/Fnr family transcriptional regulator [Haliovirga abyssi]|uniref:Cyclic nucleotide-binding domain-containing protein n=1 Tax=Haliovirga abyssi TaxID=2996794 RepID=A0AAU9DDN8_9FUSO|nr:cyclic nucleotide-binding domain-containing protein [Haliovirga abyssi]BDU51636.1 hypothetical protein HLVA_22050 [Haliovirga abyssi]
MKDMKIFHGLKQETLDFIESSSKKRKYKKGDIICVEGNPADELFFIEKGKVRISSKGERLAFLAQGDGFGEMSIIDMMSRATDVIAEEDTEVFVLEKKYMYKLYKENLKEYVIILMNLARELSRRLRKMDKLVSRMERKFKKL